MGFKNLSSSISSSMQVRGIGTDIAIVSCMVFLAQFILSLCMGSIVARAGSTVCRILKILIIGINILVLIVIVIIIIAIIILVIINLFQVAVVVMASILSLCGAISANFVTYMEL